MDKVKLFLDEDVHAALSTILQKRGFDVVHAQHADKKGRPDAELLEYAVQQQRCIMSFNVKDYVQLHNDYVQKGLEHWGIIISKQLPIGETLRRVLIILQRYPKESLKNRLLFLPKENE
ncbi:DUF5615 family PIN-like protein [bacterium]|nr:DUF5615 family PIN-like protein [bacterium]